MKLAFETLPHSKDRILFILFIFLVLLSCSENSKQNNFPKHFNRIRWGTEISELQDMLFIESKGQLKAYVRKNDDFKIETADLETTFYLFAENSFCGALVEYKGFDNHNIVKNYYFEKYGKPAIENVQEMNWEWVWAGEVGVAVRYKKKLGTGYLVYLYMPLVFKK